VSEGVKDPFDWPERVGRMSHEEYAYGHVLEALTGGLYPYKLDILREYIQNAYDAIREYLRTSKKPDSCRIKVVVKAGSVVVDDNATGMDLVTIGEYRKLGFSRKSFGEYAGWRGIGKAAGLAVAEKMIVTTSPLGVPEEYQLEFDSAQMLKEVEELRATNQNIPLNLLIEKHSSIEKNPAKKKQHYTTVELFKVKSDCSELLDSDRIAAHLSQIAPVPFHPEFKFGSRIAANLSNSVEEYLPVRLFVNKEQIFKPYRHHWSNNGKSITVKEPEFLPIYAVHGESRDLIAYAWFCMNLGRGQIDIKCKNIGDPIDVSGMVYRVHDIRIGDAQLPRRTIWKASPERARYAMGEIHVLDPAVEPTADRNDFKDNLARYNFYQACIDLPSEINRKAGRQSLELRAEEKIERADASLHEISKKLRQKQIPRELVPQIIYRTELAKDEAIKSKPNARTKRLKAKADQIVSTADKLTSQFAIAVAPATAEPPPGVYDLTKQLGFSRETTAAYDAMIRALGEYFINEPRIYEELVGLIQRELRKLFTPQD
jgi:hypothetical protein